MLRDHPRGALFLFVSACAATGGNVQGLLGHTMGHPPKTEIWTLIVKVTPGQWSWRNFGSRKTENNALKKQGSRVLQVDFLFADVTCTELNAFRGPYMY